MADDAQLEELKEPLGSDAPCGEDLEDSQLLASFDAYRLFGRSAPFDPAPDWREIEKAARAALQRSKDFRLLAHLGAAILRTRGLPAFLGVLEIASSWLEQHWTDVFPRIDDDAILRKNALNCFADRMAVIDGVRRYPFLRHPQLGTVSLRDIDIATGQQPADDAEQTPDQSQIQATLMAVEPNALTELKALVDVGLESLQHIETRMRDEGGAVAAPEFDPLQTPLRQLHRVLAEALSQRDGDSPAEAQSDGEDAASAAGTAAAAVRAPGSITSRQDAIRALDAVAAYFRQTEPSSPVPLFVERAKRLIGKDLLEVLADIAPDAVSQARAAGGLRDEE